MYIYLYIHIYIYRSTYINAKVLSTPFKQWHMISWNFHNPQAKSSFLDLLKHRLGAGWELHLSASTDQESRIQLIPVDELLGGFKHSGN